MSAGCSYCYRTAWWECRQCDYIMCDECDPLHRCHVQTLAGQVIAVHDHTPMETTILDELTQDDIGG